jgi:uncharacterized protein YndB with AHSA1/START domain
MMRGVGTSEKLLTVTGEYREIGRTRLLVFTSLPDWQEGVRYIEQQTLEG